MLTMSLVVSTPNTCVGVGSAVNSHLSPTVYASEPLSKNKYLRPSSRVANTVVTDTPDVYPPKPPPPTFFLHLKHGEQRDIY